MRPILGDICQRGCIAKLLRVDRKTHARLYSLCALADNLSTRVDEKMLHKAYSTLDTHDFLRATFADKLSAMVHDKVFALFSRGLALAHMRSLLSLTNVSEDSCPGSLEGYSAFYTTSSMRPFLDDMLSARVPREIALLL